MLNYQRVILSQKYGDVGFGIIKLNGEINLDRWIDRQKER